MPNVSPEREGGAKAEIQEKKASSNGQNKKASNYVLNDQVIARWSVANDLDID